MIADDFKLAKEHADKAALAQPDLRDFLIYCSGFQDGQSALLRKQVAALGEREQRIADQSYNESAPTDVSHENACNANNE